MPPAEGFPIPLNQKTSGGKGISLEDLESEPAVVIHKTSGGQRTRLVATYNPFLMKGATDAIRRQNAGQEAEIELIAISMASQWRGRIKEPSEPEKPLLNPDAMEASDDEIITALVLENERQSSRKIQAVEAPHQRF